MKSKIRSICIITGSYPTSNNPVSTFVDQLVCAWADLGIDCTVIVPSSITSRIANSDKLQKREWIKRTVKGNKIKIYSPRYLSFSKKQILGLNTGKLTLRNFKKAVYKEIKRLKLSPDVIYGHFIAPAGITAAYIGKKLSIPSYVAYGESSPTRFEYLGNEKVAKMLKNITGVISVSTENKRILVERKIVDADKIGVFPNGVDNSRFYQRDKIQMRKKLGFGEKDFIVAFVGHFNNRKGSKRLSKALEKLDGVKSIFIGSGPDTPTSPGIIFMGRVPHENIPEYLSASDVFVLPTLNEGCSNAVIEAMACGLPIISSDRSFNDDILNEENSIRIDPNDIESIRSAIKLLRDNKDLREKMSVASLEFSKKFDIKSRAINILYFMENQ